MIEQLQSVFPEADIEVAQANLLARDSLPALVAGVDCIVHAAAGMRGAAADMFANTVVATRNLLDAATAQQIRRVVLISSFSVYHAETLAPHATLDESTPIERVGVERGSYVYAKTRQEHLFLDYQKRFSFESVILRPGVIYGPGGGAISSRVGLNALGFFFALGGNAILPLTYVDNCADAVAQAAMKAPAGSAFNVVDDNLPTCNEYLRDYRQHVQKMRRIPVPHWAFLWGSKILVSYHRKSKGQMPAVFTPYVVNSMYRPLRYTNAALKAIGWQQRISTANGLTTTFQFLRDKA